MQLLIFIRKFLYFHCKNIQFERKSRFLKTKILVKPLKMTRSRPLLREWTLSIPVPIPNYRNGFLYSRSRLKLWEWFLVFPGPARTPGGQKKVPDWYNRILDYTKKKKMETVFPKKKIGWKYDSMLFCCEF